MEPTKEQLHIIKSTGNIRVNAVAGSGKTTTMIEYAKSRPRRSKILYLAFNRTVRMEAMKKFKEQAIYNVDVETSHSIAFKNIVQGNNYTLNHKGYKIYEVARILRLTGDGEKHAEYILANHISRFMTYFCNSDKEKVQDLNYLDIVSDRKARAFVSKFYNYIEKQTRLFLSKMERGDIEITHDFYLKKFQLSNPKLNYDYILFDEGQDASAAMLDVFFKQKATKVIVGDTHQQIYGWRFAINSLEKVSYKSLFLTKSFRFSQNIADLAMDVLKWKRYIEQPLPQPIKGKGGTGKINSKAIIARTNLGLLLKAIEYVTEKKKVKSIYFEGNINSYTYAEDGASLYDVLNLYLKKRYLIRDQLIKKMNNLEELKEYIDKTEDLQLGMMVEIVEEYGEDIPEIIQLIKEKHIEGDNKENAEMVFSTVHRCKGMEYDTIQIVNDFISEEKINKLLANRKREDLNYSKLNEEINLLYVAITRAKYSVYIPEDLVPLNFTVADQIHVMRFSNEKDEDKTNDLINQESQKKEKAFSVDEVRKEYKEAYQPWSIQLDEELTIMYCEGVHIKDMAKHFGRTKGAVRSRIKKLELEDIYG